MKLFTRSHALITAAGLCSLLLAGTASADYRITAFGYSSEFNALLSKDVESAKSILGKRPLASMDFVESNNLCVAQILAEEFALAAASCTVALEKVETDLGISLTMEKSAKASIYSNLAVAKAMSGDMAAASEALEKALTLNSRDRNAVANYSLVSELLPAAELAQGF